MYKIILTAVLASCLIAAGEIYAAISYIEKPIAIKSFLCYGADCEEIR